jgi:hypothetical protein
MRILFILFPGQSGPDALSINLINDRQSEGMALRPAVARCQLAGPGPQLRRQFFWRSRVHRALVELSDGQGVFTGCNDFLQGHHHSHDATVGPVSQGQGQPADTEGGAGRWRTGRMRIPDRVCGGCAVDGGCGVRGAMGWGDLCLKHRRANLII